MFYEVAMGSFGSSILKASTRRGTLNFIGKLKIQEQFDHFKRNNKTTIFPMHTVDLLTNTNFWCPH